MSKQQLAQIQVALAVLGPRSRGHRYPHSLRDEIVAWVDAERGRGRPWSAISKSLSLRKTTLRRWGAGTKPALRARPIVVVPTSAPSFAAARLSLVGPAGWRLEGLTLDDARALVAALSC